MFHWMYIFFMIAILTGVIGFGGLAGPSAGIVQFLFFIFLVLFVFSVVTRAMNRN